MGRPGASAAWRGLSPAGTPRLRFPPGSRSVPPETAVREVTLSRAEPNRAEPMALTPRVVAGWVSAEGVGRMWRFTSRKKREREKKTQIFSDINA